MLMQKANDGTPFKSLNDLLNTYGESKSNQKRYETSFLVYILNEYSIQYDIRYTVWCWFHLKDSWVAACSSCFKRIYTYVLYIYIYISQVIVYIDVKACTVFWIRENRDYIYRLWQYKTFNTTNCFRVKNSRELADSSFIFRLIFVLPEQWQCCDHYVVIKNQVT